jgi:hypothetical protein
MTNVNLTTPHQIPVAISLRAPPLSSKVSGPTQAPSDTVFSLAEDLRFHDDKGPMRSRHRAAIPLRTTKEEQKSSKVAPGFIQTEFEEKKKVKKPKKYAPVFSKSNKHISFPSIQLSYSYFSTSLKETSL